MRAHKEKQIVIFGVGSTGDTLPVITLGAALKQQGHSVRIITTVAGKMLVEDAGLEFFPLKDPSKPPKFDMATLVGMVAHGQDPAKSVEYFGRFAEGLVELVHSSVERGGVEGADLVVLSGLATVLEDELRFKKIPIAIVNVLPDVPTALYPPLIAGDCFGRVDGLQTRSEWERTVSTLHNAFDKLVSERNALLSVGGVPDKLDYDGYRTSLFAKRSDCPVITAFSPTLLAPPSDVPQNELHIQPGKLSSQLTPDDESKLPSSLTAFLEESSGPIIYFGYGSLNSVAPLAIQGLAPDTHPRAWLSVLNKLGGAYRAIFAAPIKPFDELTSSIHEKRVLVLPEFIPHHVIFPKCVLIVHHAGAGTCHSAAAAGVPSVTVPHFYDQFNMARLLQSKGIGSEPISVLEFSEEKLFEAVHSALSDDKMKADAKEVAKLMESEVGATSLAVDLLHKYITKL